MEISLPPTPFAAVVIEGRFDAHEVEQFRSVIEPHLVEGSHDLLLDLTNVNFIDSTALAELIRAMHRLRANGHDLVIVGTSASVRVILELTRLDLALTIRSAPEVAVAS